uniref:Uncharacterized protein n=1 Tax=Rhizophora mucronata TaxID=61149 RepID=A0A2P2QJF9_RHIMU
MLRLAVDFSCGLLQGRQHVVGGSVGEHEF